MREFGADSYVPGTHLTFFLRGGVGGGGGLVVAWWSWEWFEPKHAGLMISTFMQETQEVLFCMASTEDTFGCFQKKKWENPQIIHSKIGFSMKFSPSILRVFPPIPGTGLRCRNPDAEALFKDPVANTFHKSMGNYGEDLLKKKTSGTVEIAWD